MHEDATERKDKAESENCPGGSVVKNQPSNAGDSDSIPGLGVGGGAVFRLKGRIWRAGVSWAILSLPLTHTESEGKTSGFGLQFFIREVTRITFPVLPSSGGSRNLSSLSKHAVSVCPHRT